jgi:hypothetical protein
MMTETLMTADDADTNQSAADSTLLASQDAGQAVQKESPEAPVQSETAETAQAEESDAPVQETKQAPEKYEFQSPEGQEFDTDVLGAYEDVARELDLSQEAAQKILDKVAPALAEQQTKHVEAVTKQWRESSMSDSEFGGDKMNENLAVAKKALDSFGTPELRDLLEKSGLGNHPEVIRMLYRTGKAISEDAFVAGGNSESRKPAPTDFAGYASALYSNHPN